MKKYLILFLSFLIITLNTNAIVNKNSDSLKIVLKSLKQDTNIINTYIIITNNFEYKEKFDSCNIYIDKAIKLSKKLTNKKYLAKTLDYKGKIYRKTGMYDKSLKFHLQALDIAREINNKHLIVNISNNIGVTYRRLAEDNKALMYHFKALKLAEELNDIKNLATANNSIGIIYAYQGSYDDAALYFNKAMKIEQKRNNMIGVAINLNSIAWVYESKKDYDNAIEYYKKSLEVNKQMNNKKGMAICNNDIGKVYRKIGEYKKSIDFYKKTLKINEQSGDKRYIATSRIYLGEVYADLGNYKTSLKQLQIGLKFAQQVNSKRLIMSGLEHLSSTYEKLGKTQKALDSYRESIIYKDIIFNDEKAMQIVKMQTIYETEQKEIEIERQKNELSQKEEIIKQKNVQRNISILGVIMLLITLVVIFRSFRQKQKVNKILRKQKEEIASQAEKLNETNKELIKTNKLKELFFARISHEIRTPVNVIVGFTNLLQKMDLQKKANSYVENIKISCSTLLVTINDLLDFSKIDAGKLKIESIEFNLLELLSNFKKNLSVSTEQKNIKFTVNDNRFIPKCLIGDPFRLNQILTNIVSNSIKYTSQNGEITLLTKVLNQNKNNAEIQFAISDTGIGIPADRLKNIFKDYVQAEDETSRKYGGTGLGLAIVKNLIDLQNGNVELKSEQGKGTDFIFSINYKKPNYKETVKKQKSNSAEENTNIKNLRILLADDNPINRILTIDTIKNFNKSIKIDEAENGKIAIEMLRKNDYNLLLLDIIMPVIDGFEATQIIRNEFPEQKNKIPILGMTANALKEEKDKCLAIGMNEYITKPFEPEDLFDKIKILSKKNS
ncbi:MAG: tetratricopeptide repeat protein [Bacteroidales bacterium]|nr:tetratricopeptide repeat protein [Bacteroidales bacterium]